MDGEILLRSFAGPLVGSKDGAPPPWGSRTSLHNSGRASPKSLHREEKNKLGKRAALENCEENVHVQHARHIWAREFKTKQGQLNTAMGNDAGMHASRPDRVPVASLKGWHSHSKRSSEEELKRQC